MDFLLSRAMGMTSVRLSDIPGMAALLVIAGAFLMPALCQAAGDAKAGSDVFAGQCAECHSLKEGKNKKGPSMFAIVGRKAASIADFKYSDAMKASGFQWTAAQIDAYITLPKKAVPGGTMKFDGLPDAKERADLIEFLATVK
ncbi:MAG: c-type cytochrome [Rhizobacter sp.]